MADCHSWILTVAKSTGIVLTATAISFTNEWAITNKPNLRVAVAGLGVALLFDGIEKISEQGAVGLAYIMLITVVLTPINGSSPADTVIKLMGYNTKAGTSPLLGAGGSGGGSRATVGIR